MSELVRAGSGVLLRPRSTFSHTDPPVPVLGRYANISVSMDAQVRGERLECEGGGCAPMASQLWRALRALLHRIERPAACCTTPTRAVWAVQDICAGVSRVLALSREELLNMGRTARGLFVADRADFEGRMGDVRALLHSLAHTTQQQGGAAAA
jgi:hypothetical protein